MDDTLEFIIDLKNVATNKKLKKILECIELASPSEDLAYGDWNDRQDFMENEYDALVKQTVKELENDI